MSESSLPPGFVPGSLEAYQRLGLGREPEFVPLGYNITHVPDAVYPWWEHQIDRIRANWDPGIMPIFRRMAYRTRAGGILTFINHGVARWDRDQERSPDIEVLRAPKPRGWKYGRANVVERWFGRRPVRRSKREKHNLPHQFVMWGEWVERWSRETFFEATAAEKQRYIDEHGEAAQARKAREFEESEKDYRAKQELKYQREQFEQLGPEDERETRARMAGRWKKDPKPYVFQGASL